MFYFLQQNQKVNLIGYVYHITYHKQTNMTAPHKFTKKIKFVDLCNENEASGINKRQPLDHGFYVVVKASRYSEVWAAFSVDAPCNSPNTEYYCGKAFNWHIPKNMKDKYVHILTKGKKESDKDNNEDGVLDESHQSEIDEAIRLFDESEKGVTASDFYDYEFMEADRLANRVYEAYCEH